jgi:DNA-binding CsgD family transcriptional regulator
MNCGGILLDQEKRVIHLNKLAQTAVGETFTTKSGRLCAADRMSDALLQTLLDQSLKYAEDHRHYRRQALGLRRAHKRPLILRVVPVEPEAKSHLNDAALVLVLVDPEDCPQPSHTVLQQVFGITRSEARVANRLMCGESLQDIAGALGVSVGTVRSQIKALFAKTGTNRQAELVRLLTRLAMISEDNE